MGKVFDIPQCLSKDSSLFWSNHNFWTLAIENELWPLAFEALSEWGFEIWIWKGCGLGRYFPSVFGVVAKFPRRKSDSILPYFRGRTLAALCLKCVIAHRMLFLPSFRHENMAMGMPHFHGKN